jgi:hypothetical protein
MRLTAFVLTMLFAAPLYAQTDAGQKLEPLPEAPPPPDIIKSGDVDAAEQESLEPTVTIKTEDEKKLEEYRIRGRLYMIKVTPKNAPPYYLIDKDGDGQFESRQSDLNTRVQVPKWVLTQW